MKSCMRYRVAAVRSMTTPTARAAHRARLAQLQPHALNAEFFKDDRRNALGQRLDQAEVRLRHVRDHPLAHRLVVERVGDVVAGRGHPVVELHLRSEEHTSELQSLMRTSYAVICLNKKHNNSKH